ncbi:MAG TPA: metallophosphoesterase family protein [Clostridiales bacterium]|jgi:hypothetical protein|nr:metallophosphoesterase family protein [Clostridiales bacterium]HRT82894.1 metallophosphoesterase family protein [Oscillospiraceae bacterium]
MVYVTGDIHGDIERFDSPTVKKLKKGDTLLICGDFGFIWDGSKQEQKILKKLGRKKYNIYFIDGTHENFELLNQYPVVDFCGGKARQISGKLYHLMRGQVFTFEGKTYFTMGGGESPDIDMRIESKVWNTAEIPNREELKLGAHNLDLNGGRVNFIITHEPPQKVKGFLELKSKEPSHVTGLNSYFEELSKYCGFDRWFFGSMHIDKYISSSHTAAFLQVYDVETGKAVV